MRLAIVSVAALCAAFLSPGAASAQTPKPAAPAVSAPEGKKPAHHLRFAARKKHGKIGPSTPIATYPGFKVLDDGSSRVFVEVSRKVDIVETKTDARVSYRIKGAFAPVRTNRLALLTDFFRSPVERVQLVEDGDDLDLVIDLREATEVQHRIVDIEGGVLLQVDFGKSARVDAPVADADGAPSAAPATRTTETKRIGSGAPASGTFTEPGL